MKKFKVIARVVPKPETKKQNTEPEQSGIDQGVCKTFFGINTYQVILIVSFLVLIIVLVNRFNLFAITPEMKNIMFQPSMLKLYAEMAIVATVIPLFYWVLRKITNHFLL